MEEREFKNRIQELRTKIGYSQDRIAQIIGISLNSFRKIEKGETALVSPRLKSLANALKVRPIDIFLEPESEENINILEEVKVLREENDRLKKYVSSLESLSKLQEEKIDSYTKK